MRNFFKTKLKHAVMAMVAAVVITACDEEEPKNVPQVVTGVVTEITPTSAIVTGEITDDGNSPITESGIVFSSFVQVPTTADEKSMIVVETGAFTSLLENLKSGTSFYARAYATNEIGTAYGEVVSFTTGNLAPTATNVTVTGSLEVNKTITGAYTYSDPEGDTESGSVFKWYVANDITGAGETVIDGATSTTYLIPAEHEDKYIRFGVTPKAATGSLEGAEARSSYTAAVGEATTVTFTYNGSLVTYGIITSTVTNRKWLDRNLGAPNAPASFDDFANYGDLFQWGRPADRHQLVIHSGNTNDQTAAVNEPETTTQSTTDTPGHEFFIRDSSIPLDWRNPKNDVLWQGVDGVNNPCPQGWRIPTRAEWEAEMLTTMELAYIQLKLTLSGTRSGSSGNFSDVGTSGRFWSSTIVPSATTSTTSYRITVNTATTTFNSDMRASGNSCRCIKD